MAGASAAGHTYVQYFVPDDGDVEAHPNIFLVKKPVSELSVGDIQAVSSALRGSLKH